MKSKIFLQLIIFTFAFFAVGMAEAAVPKVPLEQKEVREWAESRGNELLSALSESDMEYKYALLDNLFTGYVDLDFLAKFVMGKYWKVMTADEQLEFRGLFRRYVLEVYKTYPLTLDYRVSFQIFSVQVQPQKAVVAAQIHQEGLPQNDPLQDILVQFDVRRTESGLKLSDLKIGETSLAMTYRGKFYRMMAEDDGEVAWFLEDFRQIIDSLERRNDLARDGEFPY